MKGYMNRPLFIKQLIVVSLIICLHNICSADSLWDPGFKGYLSSHQEVKVGDLVLIEIKSDTKLSFVSSSKGNKVLTLQFSGGEYGKLFDFLPVAQSSGTMKQAGEEEIALESVIVARVQRLEGERSAYVEGSRSLEINGMSETVTISGYLFPGSISSNGTVPFSGLADARLVFKTLLSPGESVLTDADILEALEALAEEMPGETAAGETAPVPVVEGAGTGEETAPSVVGVASSEQQEVRLEKVKKKELLIRYINKLLDVIFQ